MFCGPWLDPTAAGTWVEPGEQVVVEVEEDSDSCEMESQSQSGSNGNTLNLESR